MGLDKVPFAKANLGQSIATISRGNRDKSLNVVRRRKSEPVYGLTQIPREWTEDKTDEKIRKGIRFKGPKRNQGVNRIELYTDGSDGLANVGGSIVVSDTAKRDLDEREELLDLLWSEAFRKRQASANLARVNHYAGKVRVLARWGNIPPVAVEILPSGARRFLAGYPESRIDRAIAYRANLSDCEGFWDTVRPEFSSASMYRTVAPIANRSMYMDRELVEGYEKDCAGILGASRRDKWRSYSE